MYSVEVRSLCLGFGNFEEFSLRNVNLSLKKSSIYCLIGPSGSGKTTLLSCILGMKNFTSGSISVLGSKDISKVSHQIGFMPQHVELVPKLTVAENLSFFGKIHHLEKKKLRNQLKMLSELLELNFLDSQVTDLSGGEKRRVALAAALIHDPQLLILDEPTVGLDVLLRQKIWDYLQIATENRQMSVLVTTHYIFEAQFAHRCGFIRKGAILAENSPSKIIISLQVENLDEAFVELCRRDEVNLESTQNIKEVEHFKPLEIETTSHRRSFALQNFSALYTKEFHRFRRTPIEFFLLTCIPIIQVIFGLMALGKEPNNLKIGFLNLETQNCSNFTNFCETSLSCNYLTNMRSENYSFSLKSFDSFEDGHLDLKKGKIYAFLVLSENFSRLLLQYNKKPRRKADLIEVYHDQSDFIISGFIKNSIYDTFEELIEKLEKCDGQKKQIWPIRRFDVHGKLFHNIQSSFISNLMVTGSLFTFALSCFLPISAARSEGVWNLTLLAGVQTHEVFIMHFTWCLVQCTFMIIEIILSFALLFPEIKILQHFWILFALLFLLAIECIFFEFWISLLIRDFTANLFTNMQYFIFLMIVGGMYWPIDAYPKIIYYISLATPVALPSISIRYILQKEVIYTHPAVQHGFAILFFWIFVFSFACFFALRKSKFVVNSK